MINNLVPYYCSGCNQRFSLDEDHDDACPYCGEYQLEYIDPHANKKQQTIQFAANEESQVYEEKQQ